MTWNSKDSLSRDLPALVLAARPKTGTARSRDINTITIRTSFNCRVSRSCPLSSMTQLSPWLSNKYKASTLSIPISKTQVTARARGTADWTQPWFRPWPRLGASFPHAPLPLIPPSSIQWASTMTIIMRSMTKLSLIGIISKTLGTLESKFVCFYTFISNAYWLNSNFNYCLSKLLRTIGSLAFTLY